MAASPGFEETTGLDGWVGRPDSPKGGRLPAARYLLTRVTVMVR